MKAVLFAAGLGTRLGEITRTRPKALVEVQGRPMLYRVMDNFRQACIRSFVINVHAFADMVEAAVERYVAEYPEVHVDVSDERDCLLETGGGLLKMRPFLSEEPFLVHNVDILTDLDLASLTSEKEALAYLAVRRVQSDRYFLFNPDGILCGWENVRTSEIKMSRPQETHLERFGFMGIHYICPSIFPLLTEKGVFSITDAYLRLARDHEIRMIDCSSSRWMDIGSPQQLLEAQSF